MASCTYWNLRSSLNPPPSASTRTNTRFCGSKPTSTLRRLFKHWRNSPAPTSNTTEMDTCTTRSARDSIVFEAATLRLVSFSALPTSIFVARSAGAMPKMIPVSMVMPDVNATMRQSAGADVPTGAGRSGCPQRASARPAIPPRPASSRLSVSSWRTSRHRVAPIDSRTEISR